MQKPGYVLLNVTNLSVTTVTLTRHFQSKLTKKVNQHLPVCSKNFPSLSSFVSLVPVLSGCLDDTLFIPSPLWSQFILLLSCLLMILLSLLP